METRKNESDACRGYFLNIAVFKYFFGVIFGMTNNNGKVPAATEENGMDEPKQKIKPLVRGVRDAVAEEVLLARNLPVGIVRGSIPEAAEMMTDQRCIKRCRISKFFFVFCA